MPLRIPPLGSLWRPPRTSGGPRWPPKTRRQPQRISENLRQIRRPNGPGRAKISGNWLTVFLVRARGAAPGGPPAKSTPPAARPQPDQVYSEMVFLLGATSQAPQSAPRVPQEAPKTAQEAPETPKERSKTPKMTSRRAQEAAKTLQEASTRPPSRAPTCQNHQFY